MQPKPVPSPEDAEDREKKERLKVMTNTVKLQGISGQQKGTKTKDLKIGDVIIWDFGYKSEIVDITPSKTGKTITFMLKSFESGNILPRKMGAERLVVVEKKQEDEPKNKIEKALKNRKPTYSGIYSDVGMILDNFTTEELADYYINVLGCESPLRYYLEQQIIAGEISKLKNY